MSNTELLIRLRDLHEELVLINSELQSSGQVDEDTIDALGQLVSDASQLIDRIRDGGEPEEQASDHQDLLDKIQKFDSEHPGVKRFLHQMTDLLTMIGI
jgi:hypothetical protein